MEKDGNIKRTWKIKKKIGKGINENEKRAT